MLRVSLLALVLCLTGFAETTVKPNNLSPITNNQIADNDLFLLFDTSAGVTKKLLVSQLDLRYDGGGGGGGGITSLTGEVTASGTGAVAATVTNSAVIAKVLTGFSASAGVVSSSSSILEAFNKVVGNLALLAPLASPTFTGTITTPLTASRAVVTNSSSELATLVYTNANTASALVQRDGSGNFSAGTVTAALSGNASTATALASNPTDCSSGQYATTIAANGNLTCAAVSQSEVTGAAPTASPAFTTQITFGNYHLEPAENDSGNSGTTKTVDWSVKSAQKSTLTGNVTYTFSNPVTGASYVLRIATGAGGFSTTWPGSVIWLNSTNSGPSTDSTGGNVCLCNFYYDGTNYWGSNACTY